MDVGELCASGEGLGTTLIAQLLLSLQDKNQHYSATTMIETHFNSTAASSLALAFTVFIIVLLTHQISAKV